MKAIIENKINKTTEAVRFFHAFPSYTPDADFKKKKNLKAFQTKPAAMEAAMFVWKTK